MKLPTQVKTDSVSIFDELTGAFPLVRSELGRLCRLKFGYTRIRVAVGLILIAAAASKTFWLHYGSAHPIELFFGYKFPVAIVAGVEFVVGCGVIYGWGDDFSWAASLAIFSAFIIMTAFRLFGGAVTCDCFGGFGVAPQITLTLDVAVVAILLTNRPPRAQDSTAALRARRWRRSASIVCYLAIAGISIGSLQSRQQRRDATGIDQFGDLLIIDPREWVGHPLALVPHINDGSRLSVGRWSVIFFRHDCPRRQQLVDRQLAFANTRRFSESTADRLALVEVPPYQSSTLAVPSEVESLRLTDRYRWLFRTPLEASIEDGSVISIHP